MVGIVLAELLFGLPALVVLATLIVIFSNNFFFSAMEVIATLVPV
jgi:hypothetical protein